MCTRSKILALMATMLLAAGPAWAADAAKAKDEGKELFDGKTLSGWKTPEFGGEGKVYVKDGMIVMERGESMTGITFNGKPLKNNY